MDFSFTSTGKFLSSFVFVDSWMIFGWLGVSMLISLSLMIFVEDPFGSVSVSPLRHL